jgi:hypothetical protein
LSSLDYYVQRPFVMVHENLGPEANSDTYDPSAWAIELEGNALIRNHDGRRTALPDSSELRGTSLLKVDYHENATVLSFGQSSQAGMSVAWEIALTPHLYSVADATYTGGEEVWPQRPVDEDDPLPPDPSPQRVADGPDIDSDGFAGEGAGQ